MTNITIIGGLLCSELESSLLNEIRQAVNGDFHFDSRDCLKNKCGLSPISHVPSFFLFFPGTMVLSLSIIAHQSVL